MLFRSTGECVLEGEWGDVELSGWINEIDPRGVELGPGLVEDG